MRSLRGPRALDELFAFQSLKRVTNYGVSVADKARNVVGAGKTCTVAVHEHQYVPLTEQANPHALQATLNGALVEFFAADDKACPGLDLVCCFSHNQPTICSLEYRDG